MCQNALTNAETTVMTIWSAGIIQGGLRYRIVEIQTVGEDVDETSLAQVQIASTSSSQATIRELLRAAPPAAPPCEMGCLFDLPKHPECLGSMYRVRQHQGLTKIPRPRLVVVLWIKSMAAPVPAKICDSSKTAEQYVI